MNATLERLERVLAMVPWLLAHPGAHIDAVAERFGATRQEVMADLDALGFCGVPGYGGGDLVEVAVLGEHVQVRMADFFRRPLRLDVRESMTLLLAGRALLGGPDIGDQDALRRAVRRLEKHMGSVGVAVELGTPDPTLLAPLRDAVKRGRVIRLRYRSAGHEQETPRLVEPWALIAARGSWYLRGHCREAGGTRNFRVDRIRDATVTDEAAPTPPADALAEVPGWHPGEGDVEVVLDLDDEAAWLVDAVPGAELVADARVRFAARSLEWAARLVLGLAGAGRVVAPDALTARVRDLASAARERYRDDPVGPEHARNA